MSAQHVVMYHASCADGFCAAWVMQKVFPRADYIPCQYGQRLPCVRDSIVYIVDFSFKRQELLHLAANNASVVVLDHHKTAEEELGGLSGVNLECVFDLDKSGARLTLDLLARRQLINAVDHQTVLPLVNYTEDRDLWRWRLPNSQEINAAIRSYPMTFAAWDELAVLEEAEWIAIGKAILRYQKLEVERAIEHAYLTILDGYSITIVNAVENISEVSQELAKASGIGCVYFDTAEGKRVYSLRSTKTSGIDVSEIAKKYGGGGHKHAAGFSVPLGMPIKQMELGRWKMGMGIES